MPSRRIQATHTITERQKFSTGSYHARQKAAVLINWILVNLAMCKGKDTPSPSTCVAIITGHLFTAKSYLWFQRRGKNPKKATCNIQVKLLRKKYTCQLIRTYWSISGGLTCAIFFGFWSKHILTLLSWEEILLVKLDYIWRRNSLLWEWWDIRKSCPEKVCPCIWQIGDGTWF